MLKLLTNVWLIRVLGFAGLASVVVLVGPLIAIGDFRPLASPAGQGVFILLIVVAWLIRQVLRVQRANRAETQMVDAMLKAPAAPAEPDASAEELATLKGRFEDALGVLKKARGGKGRLNLYDLPWYIIIGPPGSGKTTALLNSGLRFPLAERFGPDAIRGVGGTRNCDWWFTDDAILIDTAGRYTTQDSDANVDQSAWLGFLGLLKKYRRRRPINGVFVAISIADLLTQSEAERRAHAAAIRQRVLELDKHFGIRFPVYVLFTKSDLVAGFAEYFEDLGRTEREQVWGITFPYSDDPDANPVKRFGEEFDLLVRRLNERLVARVGQEPDPARRAAILGFPKQMAALKEILVNLLGETFLGSRYETGPLLRGTYFTSGTQEGTPIDRLMGALARAFQIEREAAPQAPGRGKSYFITDVLRKVAFNEANLAGTNRRAELGRAWLQRAAYAGSAAVLVLLIVAWGFAYVQNQTYVRTVAESTDRARELIAAIDGDRYDVLEPLAALDAVRNIPGGYADRLDRGFRFGGFGLSQEDKLGDQAVASYRRLLNRLLLSRLMLRLEEQLRGGGASSEYTYEALKAYLMLDSREHYDPAAIIAFIGEDWNGSLARMASVDQRRALDGHLEALFEERPLPLPLPLNEPAIDRARAEVLAMPLEERIYSRLKREFATDIPGFNIRDAAGGPAAELVFIRKSGRPLSEAAPGLFTKAGYQRVFEQRSESLIAELASESWILGERATIDAAEQERLLGRVRELYLAEFEQVYASLLLDVTLAPFSSPEEAARLFNVLARPEDSPLLRLLQEVARQTSLESRETQTGLVGRAGNAVAQAQEELRRRLGTAQPAPGTAAEALARNLVEERFRALNALVAQNDGQPRPVDHLLGLFGDLYQYLSVVASEAAGGAIPPHVQERGQAVLQEVRVAASTQPSMLVGELLGNAASRTAALTTGGLRAYLNEQWRSGPLAVCRRAIEGRYPLERSSDQTVRLDDFGEFFGYGGIMDSFFNTHLRSFVDATTSPWRTRATGNVPIQLSAAALRAFESADAIKRTFFRPGSMEPSVSFDLRPLEMDASLASFLLHLEGAEITYAFGPRTSTLMQWPGPNPGSDVRLEFTDRQSGATQRDTRTGPWAWFRLLDESGLQPTAVPEQFEVTFSLGGRSVIYELTARSAFNPFASPDLERFECPANL
jgi:type VI secretion system protein ImpL